MIIELDLLCRIRATKLFHVIVEAMRKVDRVYVFPPKRFSRKTDDADDEQGTW